MEYKGEGIDPARPTYIHALQTVLNSVKSRSMEYKGEGIDPARPTL